MRITRLRAVHHRRLGQRLGVLVNRMHWAHLRSCGYTRQHLAHKDRIAVRTSIVVTYWPAIHERQAARRGAYVVDVARTLDATMKHRLRGDAMRVGQEREGDDTRSGSDERKGGNGRHSFPVGRISVT